MNNQLRKELRQAGASDTEITELLPIAGSLSRLKNPRQKHIPGWRHTLKPASFVLAGICVSMLLVIISRSALPTSHLYAIQKASDSVAIRFHPSYRTTVMMKRARQVNELVTAGADKPAVLAALRDYNLAVGPYKYQGSHYAAFEYCKASLQQAAKRAPADLRRSINTSLAAIQDI